MGTFLDTDTDKPTTGQAGDYIIVIDTSVTPRTANVWKWNGTAFANTDKSVENFGLQFATGQAVNEVGIDDEPTAGSDNLVKSNGVFSSLICKTKKCDLSNLSNWWRSNNNWYRFSDRHCFTIELDSSKQYVVYGENGTTTALFLNEVNFVPGGTIQYGPSHVVVIGGEEHPYPYYFTPQEGDNYLHVVSELDGVSKIVGIYEVTKDVNKVVEQNIKAIKETERNVGYPVEDENDWKEVFMSDGTITDGYSINEDGTTLTRDSDRQLVRFSQIFKKSIKKIRVTANTEAFATIDFGQMVSGGVVLANGETKARLVWKGTTQVFDVPKNTLQIIVNKFTTVDCYPSKIEFLYEELNGGSVVDNLRLNDQKTSQLMNIQNGVYYNGDIVFNSSDVRFGDSVNLSLLLNLEVAVNTDVCYLSFYRENDERIEYFGKGSSSTEPESRYDYTFNVPADFSYAKLNTSLVDGCVLNARSNTLGIIEKNRDIDGVCVGADNTTYSKDYLLEGDTLYVVTLDSNNWNVSNSTQSAFVIFGIVVNITGTVLYEVRITKADAAKRRKRYCVKTSSDGTLRVAFRGSAGEKVGYTITKAEKVLGKKLYDIYFVDASQNIQESMIVRLNVGDVLKYKINTSSGSVFLKAYSRADREAEYMVDSVTAESTGIVSGVYKTNTSDVFVVIESEVSNGFTPEMSIWTVGINYDGTIVFPEQLIFDTDNKFAILSPQDEDASIYDNELINYGQIIPTNGMYYMLYQGFGTFHSQSSNILMAYSEDGIHWTRGIPDSIPNHPIPGTNVIFNRDNVQYIANEFVGAEEVVNEFGVAVVNDNENKYRMFCAIRKDSPNTIVGECHYLFKSNDLVHWTNIRKVDIKAHDSFSCIIPYGDKMKVYLRMWDYTKPLQDQRMIGVMWLDIWGNVIVPASGIFGHGLYNSAAVKIGDNRDLLIPTHFYIQSGMVGDNSVETYIIDNGIVKYAPSYNIDNLRDKGQEYYSGWNWCSGLVAIGLQQYVLYGQRSENHGSATVTDTHNQLRLCPVRWVTYDSYNRDSD